MSAQLYPLGLEDSIVHVSLSELRHIRRQSLALPALPHPLRNRVLSALNQSVSDIFGGLTHRQRLAVIKGLS